MTQASMRVRTAKARFPSRINSAPVNVFAFLLKRRVGGGPAQDSIREPCNFCGSTLAECTETFSTVFPIENKNGRRDFLSGDINFTRRENCCAGLQPVQSPNAVTSRFFCRR